MKILAVCLSEKHDVLGEQNKKFEDNQVSLKIKKMIRSSKNQNLVLKIENGNGKSKINLPPEIHSQLEIVYRKKSYFLKKSQVAYSGYLNEVWQRNYRRLEITEELEGRWGFVDETKFQNILLVMQGDEIEVDRSEVGGYFELAQFLQISRLVQSIKNDIIKNIDEYNIFVIFAISQQYLDQELFELCHEQLYKQQFEQISYHEYEFLHLKLSLFRLTMKMHNKYKLENGMDIKHIEVDDIIKRYCEMNQLPPDTHQTLKLELIDFNSLSSKDYKTIFLDESHNSHADCHPQQMPTEMKLRMQNTFQRKRNNQLTIQNNNLGSQLQNLRNQTQRNIGFQDQMVQDLKMLRKEMSKKQQQNLQLKKVITKYQSMLEYMQSQLQKKTSEINVLVSKFEQLKCSEFNLDSPTNIDEEEQQEANAFVKSQYLPSHFIQEIMAKHKKQSEQTKSTPKAKDQNSTQPEDEVQMII